MTPMLLADAAFFHKAKLENPNSGIGLDIRERMMIGYNTTGLEYASSNRAKENWTRDVSNIFNEVDVIITPTVSFAAPPADKSLGMISTTKDLTRLTFVWSFAEVPAMSIPCGFTREGLPMGLQLIGPWWKESTLFALGHSFQQETDFHLCKPNKLC
jgi:aspartyl-tRNA(Asn)/glutamyl-tRNA(Gln) amidotransferase subunit A